MNDKYMPSQAQTKLISRLRQKKYRSSEGLFVAEGRKLVGALLGEKLTPTLLFCTAEQAEHLSAFGAEFKVVSARVLQRLSAQTTPSGVLGVFPIPKRDEPPTQNGGVLLALDQIRDPGNLGTILRLADWFGIQAVLCSKNSVDAFNAKVVQSSMGSIARVAVYHLDLEAFFSQTPLHVYAADLQGQAACQMPERENLILLMGGESHGISAALKPYVRDFIHIPKHDPKGAVESLNVASATAILLHEIRRG